MHEGNLSKIEVLLDKVNLVLQAVQSADEPEPYDLRLLEKYLSEAAMLAGQMTGPEAKIQAVPKSPQPEEPVQGDTQQPGQPKENEEIKPERKPSRITPIEEQEKQEQARKSDSIRFVPNEPEEEQPEESAGPAQKSVSGNDDNYEEIFKQLEEIKKNRAKLHEVTDQQEAETEKPPTEKPKEVPKATQKPTEPPKDEAEEDSSLNDSFRWESDDLAHRLTQKPIGSLVHEIDLNDKFWFINELFDGDGTTFTKLLRELDKQPGLDQALRLVEQEVEGQFDWSEKERAKQKFYDILRRRF